MVEGLVGAELEAKLLVPNVADVRAIARLLQIGPYGLRPRDVKHLHSMYLDTPERVLTRHWVALRLRRASGRWEVTAKWAGEVNGVVHERPELTVPLEQAPTFPFELPEGLLRVHLAALVAGRPLTPVMISDVRRRRIDILGPGAAPESAAIAELALDHVHLHPPDDDKQVDSYYEVEIERMAGERRDVLSVASLLRRSFHLMPSRQSKFARGMLLVQGPPIAAAGARAVRAGDTVEQATRKIVARHLIRVRRHDPGTRLGEDPEALHDMRVATRRLRAAFRAFAPAFPQRLQTLLREELRWLAGLLGGVRDLDVQLANLKHFGAASPPGQRVGLERFQAYIEREREQRRTAMLSGLDSPRYFGIICQLEQFAERPARVRPRDVAALEPIATVGRKAIKKAFRRLLKRGGKIHAAPTPEDLHALRIRAKRLRYLLEFLRELTGRPGRRLVKQLVQLQDLLGSYHDAVVAADCVRGYVEGPGRDVDPSTLLALGALVGSDLRVAEHSRAEFQRAWQRFVRKRNLDAFRDLLGELRPAPPTPRRPAPQRRPPTGAST